MIRSLRDRATLHVAMLTDDGQGGHVESYGPGEPVWAGVEPLGLTPDPDPVTGAARRRYRVTIRHRASLPLPARLRWRGRTLAVRTADDPDLRAQRLHLICEDLPDD